MVNIVQPYAKIMDYPQTKEEGIALLRKVEAIGRVSHRSEEAQTENSWERFIKSVVLNHGDWSITQHCFVTVEFYVDRGITHEVVRHRIGAYTQESTRFVNYSKKIGLNFICPFPEDGGDENDHTFDNWNDAVSEAEIGYNSLLLQATPELARSVLPNALASKLIATYCLSIWRYFFLMRTTKETHPQMKQVTIPLLKQFQERIPLLYDDIEPNALQRENLCKPH